MADTALTAPFSFSGVTGAGLSPNLFVDMSRFFDRNVEVVGAFHRALGLRSVMIGQQGVKSTRFGNAAHPASFAMQALSSETQVPGEIGQTVGYDSVTVAPWGLAMSDTYDKRMYGTPQLVNDTGVMRLLQSPASPVLSNLMDLSAAAVAGITAVSGATTDALTLDTLIEAIAAFNQVYVADQRMGSPKLMLHNKQVTDLQASIRTEAGYQSTGANMNAQGILSNALTPNYLGLGVDLYMSGHITSSSGARQGGLFDAGTMIVGFGDPSPVVPELARSGLNFMAMPELGLLLQQDATTMRQRKITYQLYTYLGVAMGDLNVGRQRRIQSVA